MRAVQKSFMQMLSGIRRDMMLLAACTAPILAGVFFRFIIPIIENQLCSKLGRASVIAPYYCLIDLFLSFLAPVMLCFVSAMTVLEERDEKITEYLFVTPLGRRGYLMARFGLPSAIGMTVTVILLAVFSLTKLSAWETAFLSIAGMSQGAVVSLMIVTFSSNKLEGMAITKLSTLIMLGAMVPYFVADNIQYALSPLPSFWIGRAMYSGRPINIVPALLLSLIWVYLLLKRLIHKGLQ